MNHGNTKTTARAKQAKVRVLHSSRAIRDEVHRIFGRGAGRRVAMVAYVGKGALTYLPKPSGMEVYCWPHPGGTSATAVEALRGEQAKVKFADRIHMKVYWSEKRGAVVGSANLSDNAFGVNGLCEVGVAVPSSHVDIDHLIRTIEPTEVTPQALARLREAEKRWKGERPPSAKRRPDYFAEWFDAPKRPSWKWDWWDSDRGIVSRRAKKAAKEIHPDYAPDDFAYCGREQHRDGDWVLMVKLTRTGRLLSPRWLYVERVVLVERNDRAYNRAYPFQALQVRPPRHCPPPPFQIDKRFRNALRIASSSFGGEEKALTQIDSRAPRRAFLKRIRALI
jgi:hypothetical protein